MFLPLVAGSPASAAKAKLPVPHIAFFGFAKANSFAQATWAGVQKAAKAAHGSATFFDPDFSSTTQVQQMQDAIISKKYNIFVVQANDGSAVVPEVKAAIKKGIVVSAEFTQVGSNYAEVVPQVKGVISVVEDSVLNGTDLADMAIAACGNLASCQVAYMQGDPELPLDVARTNAVVAELKTDPSVDLVGTPTGGYAASSGESTMADLLTTNPNLNVVIGSSQAMEGATITLQNDKNTTVQVIGNGGSTQAVNFVKAGTWYGTFGIPEVTDGYTAAKYAIEKLDGKHPPVTTNSANLGPANGVWTRSVVLSQHLTGQYTD
jgi:ribose transport system substrate-binding protein